MICGDTITYGWVHGWLGGLVGYCMGQWVVSCQITKYQINLDLIEIIQFFLKIYGFWSYPTHGWVVGWMSGLLCGSGSGVMSNY